jgi:uncharacterized membrane protein YczE
VPLAAPPDSTRRRRAGTLLGGFVLVAGGIALMIRAEVGVSPWDVLNTGLAETFDIPIGVAATLLPAVATVIGLLLGGRLGPGTVLAVLLVGPMLGGALALLPEVEPLAVRIPAFAVGVVLTAAGITAVIAADWGAGPAEVVMLAIHERGVDLARARTGIELVTFLAGAALGGQFGVGTAVFAVGIGPLLRWMLRRAGYQGGDVEEAALLAEPGC